MTPQDEQAIADWWSSHPSGAVLLLSRGEGDVNAAMVHFCDRLQALAPGVTIRRPSDALFSAPALITGRHKNIAFQALPSNRELPPFLEALGQEAENTTGQKNLPAAAAQIQLPTALALFIAMQCPHCPRAASQLVALAGASAHLRLTLIDVGLFPEQAGAHAVRSVPTLILEDRVRWSGTLKLDEIIDQCVHRDPTQLSAGALRQLIESGDAPQLSAMMSAHGRIFPALVDLLCNERWSVRLGAMVTMEYLAHDAPELAADFIPLLTGRFNSLGETVQVDVVQVLALIGNDPARKWLENLLSEDSPAAVKEAAAEELAAWSDHGNSSNSR